MLGNELNQMLTQIHDMEKVAQRSYSIFEQNKEELSKNEFQTVLLDLKKRVIRSTMTSVVNIIDRVVEDGSLNIQGEPRQFNVNSIQVSSDDTLYLVVREVLGIDLMDKKYILDSEPTLIDFKTVTRIF